MPHSKLESPSVMKTQQNNSVESPHNTTDTTNGQASEAYDPENLKLWTMPSNYFGESWPATYVFLGQHRDSDCLTRSNFKCALAAIGNRTYRHADGSDETSGRELAHIYGYKYNRRDHRVGTINVEVNP